jgi:hypothetical protein
MDFEKEELERGISRRRALKRIGAGAAIAWSAPILTSLKTPAFAQSGPHPECVGASCGNFIPCSGQNPDCVCVDTDQGGFCVPGSTPCAGLPLCPGGNSSECPSSDFVCARNTCCGPGVCVPKALTDQCPSDAKLPQRSRRSSGRGTLGG